jgi:hypothetical protein
MKWLQLTKVVYEKLPPGTTPGAARAHRYLFRTDGPYWVNVAKATSMDRVVRDQPGGSFSYTVIAYCAYGSDSGVDGGEAHQPVDFVLEHPDDIFHLGGIPCARSSEEVRRG